MTDPLECTAAMGRLLRAGDLFLSATYPELLVVFPCRLLWQCTSQIKNSCRTRGRCIACPEEGLVWMQLQNIHIPEGELVDNWLLPHLPQNNQPVLFSCPGQGVGHTPCTDQDAAGCYSHQLFFGPFGCSHGQSRRAPGT